MHEYEWVWEGQTETSWDTSDTSLNVTVDPFPEAAVIAAAQTEVLSRANAALVAQMNKLGIAANVIRIDAQTWVETKLYSSQQFRNYTVDKWHHWLHLRASVKFETDKPLEGSPIEPATITALVAAIKTLLPWIAAAVALIIIAVGVKNWVENFGITTHTITYIDPDTGETVTETIHQATLLQGLVPLVFMFIVLFFILMIFGGQLGVSKKGVKVKGRKG